MNTFESVFNFFSSTAMDPEGELDCNQLETLHSEAGKHNYITSCILVFALFLGAL